MTQKATFFSNFECKKKNEISYKAERKLTLFLVRLTTIHNKNLAQFVRDCLYF